jgi:hypothetical protein
MKLSLVVDRLGKVIAAVKLPDDFPADGIGVGMKPASSDHQLQEIPLPSRLEATTIGEIVQMVRTYDNGQKPEIPE